MPPRDAGWEWRGRVMVSTGNAPPWPRRSRATSHGILRWSAIRRCGWPRGRYGCGLAAAMYPLLTRTSTEKSVWLHWKLADASLDKNQKGHWSYDEHSEGDSE